MDFSFKPAKLGKGADAYSSSDSDSDEETDAFRIPATDPMAGEFGEFQPRKRRRTGRDTKESAALGIFGSESEDDRHTGRYGKKQKALRQQGMSFVSSTTNTNTNGNDDDDDDEDDDDESEEDGHFGLGSSAARQVGAAQEEEDDYDDDTGGAGLGLGASSTAQYGMGFEPASFQSSIKSKSRQAPSFAPPVSFDTPTGLGQGFVPSSAYEPTLRAKDEANKKPAIIPRPSAFSAKPAGRGGASGASKFNAKSFGARMMAKMGFVEGQGLGVDGHGRNMIIEANLRPQGVGVGAVREKSEAERQQEKRLARLRGETVVSSDDDETKVKKAAAERRKKAKMGGSGVSNSGTSTPKRPKKKYMTMDEVKRAAPGLHIPDAFTPILDMTGPGKKLLTSSSGLMTPNSGAATTAATPGVSAEDTAEDIEQRKLARRAQTDFMAILEEWQSLQNRKAYADLQTEQIRQELAELEISHLGHKTMTDAFSQLSLQNIDGEDSWRNQWDKTIDQLKLAADTIPKSSMQDMKSTLADISIGALHPLFKRAMDAWEPLKATNQHIVDGLLSIQSLLGFGDGSSNKLLGEGNDHHTTYRRHKKPIATPYETMIYRLWLPPVSAAVREWDVVKDTDSILSLFEAWLPALPDFVRAQLLEHDIVRRLDGAVAKWEPKRRRHQSSQSQNLPHLWLFPWLIHLPPRHLDPASADGLVSEVKRKFRQLIDVWEFYRGVVPGLRQWKNVLRPSSSLISASTTATTSSRSADQWRPLVMSHVLPSMGRYVRSQFRVDPRDQGPYLEVITGEFQWLDLLAPELVGEVMVSEVFPMWHETLYQLLTTTGPTSLSLDQVGQWLQWWMTEVFPPKVQKLLSVSAEFQRGLVMINEALDICGDGPFDAERVREYLAPPSKGPALKMSSSASSSRHNGSGHHHHRHHHESRRHEDKDKTAPAAATTSATDKQPEEVSIRSYVEEWCENNDVQFIPERKKVHAEGRPLYRLTSRGDGRGGVLAYFKGVRLYAETKKGPVEIRVDRDDDWTKLLAMAQ
ncbi:spindle pole body component [Ophiostoma piceae UAMH 11346]|uniref:Spindle pole body component n=1 Tax=Ophiostoma piceae (strain UAMH 11346) TaxID=1262450 RepID=S3D7F5_OPHP1|nr:spindle pole body component [Ophiostoma piceae UAMH 11346]